MFNRNYLNHKFTECDRFGLHGDFICEKCSIIIYYSDDHVFRNPYNVVIDDGENGEIDYMPNITCEEYIIKNIIE